MKTPEIKDIGNPEEEFANLSRRFQLLHNRLLAVAMDYKYYFNSELTDHAIYELRDNIAFRMHSARFHFQLLLEHHRWVEEKFKRLRIEDPKDFFGTAGKFTRIHEQSTKEIYSLFDSMLYHLCSIFDYLCRIINFAHGQEMLVNPKWNVLIKSKNVEKHLYCSAELIPILQKVDVDFVYPLIFHRSNLIHTKHDIGGFNLKTDSNNTVLSLHFFATEEFRKNFPKIEGENKGCELTIKYASLWLFDQTIKSATEVLFELGEDMKRRRTPQKGLKFALIGTSGQMQPTSSHYWGDRNIT